ncbi:response regulator [Xanthomonas hyacinthi]|uniref:histidine kinase n=1 Tax=Xanthomonas hyacinthi TaxID=56455 RepID=A0A2S7ERS5_9XANT|nr:CHASE domain-containing protein [Xanthomonas hyacinthi]PPU95821.1 hybrid sensor histidine kinase/response regulator [Xanthomonas hyacinthi]QGY75327.1 response regulator [Xanthomonas hyacinthi]
MSKIRWTPAAGPARSALGAALAVLLLGLLAAALLARGLHERNRQQARDRFQQLTTHVTGELQQRLNVYEHGLRGARGAVIAAGGDRISRQRFDRYSASREYRREFPGVRGFGYVRRVAQANEAAFLQQARSDGAPSLQIRQLTPHDSERFVILYIQPLRLNSPAQGFDIASEPTRRAAAIAAARSGKPTITAPVRLLQSPGVGNSGFLLLLPIYREDLPLQTPEQRWQATTGWAYAPLNIAEVLVSSPNHAHELLLTLADSENGAPPFYRGGDPAVQAPAAELRAERSLPVYGRRWLLNTQATPGFVRSLNQTSPLLAAGLVGGISMLLAALLYLYLTGRYRRDLILREQSQLAALVGSSSEAIVAEDLHGRITHWNPAAERIFGYAPAQAIGQPLQDLLGAQVGACAGTQVRELRHCDGHVVSVLASASPIMDTDGDVVGHSHLLHDVSERVRAEARVLELNATLEQQVAQRTSELVTYSALQRAILANAGYAIVATDPDGTITLFNPAAETMLGYPAHEMIGRKATGLFLDPEQLASRAERMAAQSGMAVAPAFESVAALSTLGRSDTREWTYVGKDGRPFPVLLTLSTLRDDDDRVIGYLGIAVDLTEQKRHERELRLAIDAAETANQSKSDFLANMSHEIRTPMNAILGMLYLLQHSELPQAAKDMIQKSDASARALLEIINDILDFSKIESGRIDLESEPFDLNQLLENIAALMTSAISAKPVEMIVEPLPAGCRWLRGDALRLNQVLINLVGNAIKFTEQGEVALSVRSFPSGESGKIKLFFSVRDTGIGIARDKQSLIFSPFLQADTSTSRRYGGSGLGLTISRRLVELMGGQLEVQSTPGHGSDFYFAISFPVLPAPAAEAEHPEARRVLIADDHDLVRSNLASIASGFGWQVEAVANGTEAIAAAGPDRAGFDVILLDWRMPDLDGLRVAQRIRAQSAPDRQPIIVMVTAYERRLLEEQHYAPSDVDAVMTKPVTASALYRTIATLLARRRGDGPAPLLSGDGTPRLAGARLLVVDDSEINCEVAQRILEGEGALVELAHDGEQALQRLRRDPGRFQLVLMDVQMPTLDGYEATRLLREDPRLTGLPVIALTAGAYRQQQELALSSGMNGFIAKPFQVEELIAVIRQFLPLRLPPALEPLPAAAAEVWPTADPQLLDTAQAQRLWNERAPYQRYLLKLLQDSPDPAPALQALLDPQAPAAAISYVHKLRGSAGSLALPTLVAASAALEERLGDAPAQADAAIAALGTAMQATAAAIRRFVAAAEAAEAAAAQALPDAPAAGDGAASALPLQQQLQQLLQALDSDDPDRVERVLYGLAPSLPAAMAAELRQLVESFSFREAEAKVRRWQADASL